MSIRKADLDNTHRVALRFRTAKQVGAYAGLTCRVHQSGSHCYHGSITHEGSPWLRWVLVQVAMHVGRNTARAMGIPLTEMPVWDPHQAELGGNTEQSVRQSRVLLWKGHCSVHQVFLPEHVEQFRRRYPDIKIMAHPECMMEVVDRADVIGSTGTIIRAVAEAPPGSQWAIGTELHLVQRLKHEHPEQEIHFLSPVVCMCATMYRIDLSHLCWSLENLAAGTPVNVIAVEPKTSRWALEALKRMLEVK